MGRPWPVSVPAASSGSSRTAPLWVAGRKGSQAGSLSNLVSNSRSFSLPVTGFVPANRGNPTAPASRGDADESRAGGEGSAGLGDRGRADDGTAGVVPAHPGARSGGGGAGRPVQGRCIRADR